MELTNALYAFEADEGTERFLEGGEQAAFAEGVRTLLQLLAPFAPHVANELWELTGGEGLLEDAPWPVAEPSLLRAETLTLVVQVQGKKRGTIEVDADADQASIEAQALADPNVARFVGDAPPRRVIYVPGRLVNVIPG